MGYDQRPDSQTAGQICGLATPASDHRIDVHFHVQRHYSNRMAAFNTYLDVGAFQRMEADPAHQKSQVIQWSEFV